MPSEKLVTRRSARLVAVVACFIVLAIAGYVGASYHHKPSETIVPAVASDQPASSQTSGSSEPARISCPSDRPPLLLNIGGQPVQICGQATVGVVKSTTDTSLTVTATDGSGDVTFAIVSDTAVTEHGQTISMNDIHVGDPISVLPSDADAHTAKRLLLNFAVQSEQGN